MGPQSVAQISCLKKIVSCFCNSYNIRYFSTSFILHGKRNFRKFPLYNKRGTMEYKARRGTNPDHNLGIRSVGYNVDGKFVFVPEMIPELIVPDLTDFKLEPYVSYRVPDVVQSEFTARDLFNACYGRKIASDFKNGKLNSDGSSKEPSKEEEMTAEEAWINARKTGSDYFCPKPPLKKIPEPFT